MGDVEEGEIDKAKQMVLFDETYGRLNNAQKQKDDMCMLMEPFTNWRLLLSSAPISIGIFGQLMLVAAGAKDFSLLRTKDHHGNLLKPYQFKFITHPESFKASLVQLANEGWNSFNAANTNMDRIRISTLLLPERIKEAITTLLKGTNEEVKTLLPNELQAVTAEAVKCKKLAEEVCEKFSNTLKLIDEISVSGMSVQGSYEEEYRKVIQQAENAERDRSLLEDQMREQKNRIESIKTQVASNKKLMQDALKEIPTGFKMVTFHVFEQFGNTIGFLGNLFKKDTSSEEESERSQGKEIVWEELLLLGPIAEMLEEIAGGGEGKLNEQLLQDEQGLQYVLKLINLMSNNLNICCLRNKEKNQIETYKKKIKFYTDELKECIELAKTSQHSDDEGRKCLAMKLLGMAKTMSLIAMTAQTKLKLLMGAQGPLLSNTRRRKPQAPSDWTRTTMKGAHYKVEHQKEMLMRAQDDLEAAFNNLSETNKEHCEILKQLASLDLTKIDFDEIIKTLKEGMSVLAKQHSQWRKLVELFSMISSVIEDSMNSHFKSFTDTIDGYGDIKLGGIISNSKLLRDKIYKHVMEAHKCNYAVHLVSKKYCEVSKKYIMPAVGSLNEQIFRDPETEKNEIEETQKKLLRQCEDAEKFIKENADDDIKEMCKKIENRREELKELLGYTSAVLSDEEKNDIDEVIEKS